MLDPSKPVMFEPSEGSGRRYALRVPRVADVVQFRAEVRRAGGRQHGMLDLLRTARAGIEELMPDGDPDRSTCEQLIDAQSQKIRAALGPEIAALPDEERAQILADAFDIELDLGQIVYEVERHYPPLAGMAADNEAYPGVAGIVAAGMFLEGWEGLDGEPKKRFGRLTDVSIEKIPATELVAIGAKVQAMMLASQHEKKGSAASSSSRSARTGSKAASTSGRKKPRTNGRSTAKKQARRN